MSPRVVDRDERRRAIAAAALEVIAEHGFQGASMSQVAEAAGISKGTIYLYFDSKADLTVAAARTWVEAIETNIAPLVGASSDPRTRLRTLLRASTRAFLDDPRIIRLFVGITQIFLREPALQAHFELAREVSAPIREAIRGILIDGAERGIFRPDVALDAERIAINVVAFVDGIGLHHVTSPTFFDLDSQIDFYLDGLLSTLRAPAKENDDD